MLRKSLKLFLSLSLQALCGSNQKEVRKDPPVPSGTRPLKWTRSLGSNLASNYATRVFSSGQLLCVLGSHFPELLSVSQFWLVMWQGGFRCFNNKEMSWVTEKSQARQGVGWFGCSDWMAIPTVCHLRVPAPLSVTGGLPTETLVMLLLWPFREEGRDSSLCHVSLFCSDLIYWWTWAHFLLVTVTKAWD